MPTQRDAHDTITSGTPGAGELKRKLSNSPPPNKKIKAVGKDEQHHLDYRTVPSDWLHTTEKKSDVSKSVQIAYHKGDMFDQAPKGCVLIHACNTQGHWGAGIARTFKLRYPKAYADHHKFCAKDHNKSQPVPTGTSQLLAPRDGDEKHWIGCVFTSAKYGRSKDKPDMIIRNTKHSMQMLLELINKVDSEISTIRMCKINSGKFGVPWEKTEEVLHGLDVQSHWRTKIEVWEPSE